MKENVEVVKNRNLVANSNTYASQDGIGDNNILYVPTFNENGPEITKQVTYNKNNEKIFYVLAYENPKQIFDLVFIRNDDNKNRPSIDMENFRNKCENVAFVIRLLNAEDEYGNKSNYYIRRRSYFQRLIEIANEGIVDDYYQIIPASGELNLLTEEITKIEGAKIKNKYMTTLGLFSVKLIAAAGILAIATLLVNRFIQSGYTSDINQVVSLAFFVWSGAMMGSWISYGVRKFSFKFEQLLMPAEDDLMSPLIRLLFVGISAVVFAGLLVTKFIEFKVGATSIADLLGNGSQQFLSGFLFGLLESKLPGKIFDQVNNGDTPKESKPA